MSTLTGGVYTVSEPHEPIPDVIVTATSQALQGEQTVVTQGNGSWSIPELPAGTYTLRFENQSYQPKTVSHIELEEDTTKVVNVELLPAGLGGGVDA